MPAAERLGDPNTAGAAIVGVVQGSIYVNNQLLSVNGSPVAGHGKGPHSGPVTAGGSGNVFAEHIPVNRVGDSDSCGHSRASGSPNVYVN